VEEEDTFPVDKSLRVDKGSYVLEALEVRLCKIDLIHSKKDSLLIISHTLSMGWVLETAVLERHTGIRRCD